MARARLLKPDFFLDEDLAKLPVEARLLFAGLWTLADRDGRLEDRPGRIRAQIYPYDPKVNIIALLKALAQPREHSKRGFIVRYEVEGRGFIQIVNFKTHQHPHPKEPASEIQDIPAGAVMEDDGIHRMPVSGSISSAPELAVELHGEPRKEIAKTSESFPSESFPSDTDNPPTPHGGDARAVFDHWIAVTGRSEPKTRFTDERRRKVEARLREGYSVGDLCAAVDGCRLSPFHQGANESGTVYDELTLICRSGSKVEEFRARLTTVPPARAPTVKERTNVERFKAAIMGGMVDDERCLGPGNGSVADVWPEGPGENAGRDGEPSEDVPANARSPVGR